MIIARALNSHRLVMLCLVALPLGAGACGGASGKPAGAPPPTHEYVAKLSGSAAPNRGAVGGRGFVVIALRDPSHQVCWRFAHLHGFIDATTASIDAGTGTTMVALSTAPRLHHRGCVSTNVAVLRAIAGDPAAYFVRIRSIAYPAGAVRGQL